MAETAPDWLLPEMPPGYRNRVLEIQRISEELRGMERFGHLLWKVGDELADAVRDTFATMEFDSQFVQASRDCIGVRLDVHRRLLVRASAADGTLQKKSGEVARVFQMLHEVAEPSDRVVLVTNGHAATKPADRQDDLGAEALELLRRMGANILPGPTLFALWTLWLQDAERARSYVERLHEQDGGLFVLPRAAIV